MNRGDTLERKAERIATKMFERNLQPWHVKGELELEAIPEFERKKLEEMVKTNLEKMYDY